MEDKENVIFELKKDLRSVKEELNTEKIRHRRSQVVQSRIPLPTGVTRSAASSTHKSAIPAPISSTRANETKAAAKAPVLDSSVDRIRSRVLKLLQENDPQNVSKIESLMKKYKGREYELLEKMTARYDKGASKDADNLSTTSTITTVEDRPMSRQERALASHKARMQGLKDRR